MTCQGGVKPRHVWTGDELSHAEGMRAGGSGWPEIGAVFGVSGESVRAALSARARDAAARLPPPVSEPSVPAPVRGVGFPPPTRQNAARRAERPSPASAPSDLEPILWIPDVHAPYEDRRAVSLLDEVIRWFRPDQVVAVGDFADLHNVSRHVKDPAMRMSFRAELDGAKACRARIDAACADAGVKRKAITMGNHEDRLRRYIAENAPALEGVLPSISELLGFESNGWEVVEYGDVHRIGNLAVTHDLDRAGKYAHEHSRVDMGGSTIIGHTHRMAITCSGTMIAGRHVAAMFGWLGDERFARYFKTPLRAHWQLGFGVGWHDHRTGYVTLQPVPIVDYRAIVCGKLFEVAA